MKHPKVLILEPDPVLSLDLAEAVQHSDAGARIEAVESLNAARLAAGRGQPPTIAFLRMREGDAVVAFALELAARHTRIFLTGTDTVPESLVSVADVATVSLPVGMERLKTLLANGPRPPEAPRPAC